MGGKIDWNHALQAVGDSVELLLEVIEIYFEESPKLIAGIESSIESKACGDLQRFAHTLKGSLRYFGETQAGELSHELELMGRDEQIERATEVFSQLKTELDVLQSELTAYVVSQSPESDA